MALNIHWRKSNRLISRLGTHWFDKLLDFSLCCGFFGDEFARIYPTRLIWRVSNLDELGCDAHCNLRWRAVIDGNAHGRLHLLEEAFINAPPQ